MKDETCAVVQSCCLYCFVKTGTAVNIFLILVYNSGMKIGIQMGIFLKRQVLSVYHAGVRTVNWSKSFTHMSQSTCVWGPLCFTAYAYLVTLKMLSRLCVSLCEAGSWELPLYLPSCLFTVHKKCCVSLDLILLVHISLLQHRGQRESQNEERPRCASAELMGISLGVWCKIPC